MMRALWKSGLTLATLGAVSLFAGSASAHQPFCICKKVDAMTIRCEGGFFDGTGVPGVKLDMIGYDESIVFEPGVGADSAVSFQAPEGDSTFCSMPAREIRSTSITKTSSKGAQHECCGASYRLPRLSRRPRHSLVRRFGWCAACAVQRLRGG